MLYLTSLSYIEFVHYDHFKTKHNLFLNEHSLNACPIVLHLSWISCYFFLKINKYHLLYCILQYAHAATWLTLELKIFLKKKRRVSEIYSGSRGFAFRQKFMIKNKLSMFASRDVKSSGLLIIPTQGLNMYCFEMAVPAIFLSHALPSL